MTAGSAPHDALWAAIEQAGRAARCEAQLDLTDMLRPAVQPGSKIDYELPPEEVTVAFDASAAKLERWPCRPAHVRTTVPRAVHARARAQQAGAPFEVASEESCAARCRNSRCTGRRTRTTGRGRFRCAASSCRGPTPAARPSNRTAPSFARPRTRRRQLGPRPAGVLRRDRRRVRSATRFTAGAARSAPTCRTSSIATTPRSCATSSRPASPSTRTTCRTWSA